MMKTLRNILVLFSSLFVLHSAAQTSACPDVFASPDTSLCGTGGCVNLNAVVQGTYGTNTYSVNQIGYNPFPYTGGNQVLVNIDDIWSAVIPMPFCFDFFGQTYNQLLIGSNAIITFDVAQANQYCQWPISQPIPSTGNPMNSIMAPFHDIDPSVGFTANINWQVFGTAPCRQFVISWDSVPMFSCTSIYASSQLVLHETTNIIDVYMRNKPLCSTWNTGAAILGIQNATGTVAYTASNYNYPTQWTAQNEGWRFMPSGTPNFTFEWQDMSGTQLSTNTSYQVCPSQTTQYVAVVTNTSCAGTITVYDTIQIGISPGNVTTLSTSSPDICNGGVGSATTNPSGGQGPYTYTWQPGNQTTQTINGLTAGSYTVSIVDANGCAETDTIIVANTNPPVNPIIVSDAPNGQVVQAGPGSPVQFCFTTAAPGTIQTWNWLLSNAQTSNLQNACFTVSDSGLYCVQLAVQDTNGCLDTANSCVRVISEAVISFPNVFTPNGDNNNDIFLATASGVKDLKVVIYDRWGVQVYEWNGVTTGWNGKTTKGKMATDGVYYWVATITDFQDKVTEQKGFVHLISTKQ
ncbi:MAG: hypothetical protein Fur0041_08910 [Bacteroidia bacterium]